jgi:hypothetical protein
VADASSVSGYDDGVAAGSIADESRPVADSSAEANDVGTDSAADPTDTPAVPRTGDPVTRFVACLATHNVEAFIDEWHGWVMVRDDELTALLQTHSREHPNVRVAEVLLFSTLDNGAMAVAPASESYFLDNDPTGDAWRACQADHPDFRQASLDEVNQRLNADHSDQLAAEWQAALDFATRGRAAGFAWLADPVHSPAIVIPATVTESELRALLTEALEPGADVLVSIDGDALPFNWQAVVSTFPGAGIG